MERIKITLVNARRQTRAVLRVGRDGRLTKYQVHRARQKLGGIAGMPCGLLGEWPLEQQPPEALGTPYRVMILDPCPAGKVPYRLLPIIDAPEFPGSQPQEVKDARDQAEADQV